MKKSWHLGAIDIVPNAIRSKRNRFEKLRSKEEDNESDCEDEGVVSIPHLESSSEESGDEKVERGP
eukprot:1133131-Karenia_brevis.AAC.1